jgi:uncharacterized membrane protein YjfL (UPF0719 family)
MRSLLDLAVMSVLRDQAQVIESVVGLFVWGVVTKVVSIKAFFSSK